MYPIRPTEGGGTPSQVQVRGTPSSWLGGGTPSQVQAGGSPHPRYRWRGRLPHPRSGRWGVLHARSGQWGYPIRGPVGEQKTLVEQESPPAWTQEAYRPPRTLCYSVSGWGGVGFPSSLPLGGTPTRVGTPPQSKVGPPPPIQGRYLPPG